MKSKKTKEFIEKNSDLHTTNSIMKSVIKAVELAEEEMRARSIQVFCYYCLKYFYYNGKCNKKCSELVCNDVKSFIELIDKTQ